MSTARELPTGIRYTFDDLTCKVNGYQTYVWRQDPTRKKGGYQASKQWPLSATIAEMTAWRTEQVLRGKRPELFVDDGGQKVLFVTEARQDYLQREAVRKMPTYDERKLHIEEWIAVFGRRERPSITVAQIQKALDELRARLAPASVNKRRTALMHLWTTLDGRHQANPVKATTVFAEPEPVPRAPELAAVLQLLKHLPAKTNYGKKCRARLKVIAWTGWPHAIVKQLKPADLPHWKKGRAFVERRKKGKGARARWLPLLPEAVAALKEYDRVRAYGHFSNSTLHKRVSQFCRDRAIPHIRPYDLRHFFLTTVAVATRDERAVMELGLISTPAIARRYTEAATDPRVEAALAELASRLPVMKRAASRSGKSTRKNRGSRARRMRRVSPVRRRSKTSERVRRIA
jgi:integrase